MTDLSPTDQAFVDQYMPEGAMPLGYIGLILWIHPETGVTHWTLVNENDLSYGQSVGYLEMAKFDLMHRATSEEDDDAS